ncbi:sigma factor G inhibitor Gin [Cytobacillus sp. FSL H8-0458]|uniref:sigma factor G inhibitor Gin n=1 Tax=Cytobacillus sp. FSL H8-0458 TaxID=2975346 RepID=UPI0030F910B2
MGSLLAKKQAGEECVICEQAKTRGIHLYTSFICTDCENDLLTTDTNHPKYNYYLKKLRKITMPEIFS